MLRLPLHSISQLFSTHSLTPGAARPTSDLKLTCINQHLMGQPPVCPLPPVPTLKCWGGHQTHRPGRAGSRLWTQRAETGWSGGTPLWAQGGRDQPAWEGPGMERQHCPRVPWGQEPLKGIAPSRAWGDCGSRMAHHHVAVNFFSLQNHPMTKHSLTLY